jgi:hypothetical protein
MGVSGQRHAPSALYPGTHCTGGWLGPRAGLDTEAKGNILMPLPGIEPRSLSRPVRSQTLNWLSYPGFYSLWLVFVGICSIQQPENGENYIRSFRTCNLQLELLGWLREDRWNGFDMQHAWGKCTEKFVWITSSSCQACEYNNYYLTERLWKVVAYRLK